MEKAKSNEQANPGLIQQAIQSVKWIFKMPFVMIGYLLIQLPVEGVTFIAWRIFCAIGGAGIGTIQKLD